MCLLLWRGACQQQGCCFKISFYGKLWTELNTYALRSYLQRNCQQTMLLRSLVRIATALFLVCANFTFLQLWICQTGVLSTQTSLAPGAATKKKYCMFCCLSCGTWHLLINSASIDLESVLCCFRAIVLFLLASCWVLHVSCVFLQSLYRLPVVAFCRVLCLLGGFSCS